MRTFNSICLAFFTFLFLAVTGCGGGGGGSASSSTGEISVSLTDSTTDQYSAVYVTIKEVQVNVSGEGEGAEQWQVVASPNKIYDLLTLVNGVMETLGVSDLPTGHYTQMRLIIGEDITVVENRDELNLNGQTHEATGFANYIITKDDNAVHELKIPSGYQTGIKLVHEFDIVVGLTADLILDFDVAKSIVERGKSGKWNLKPTIKVLGTNNIATLAGTVTDSAGTPLPGVLVSAQIYNPDATDEKDKVIVVTTTLTATDDLGTEADETGQYKIYLKPGEYIIVATATDYYSQTAPYTAVLNAVDQQDFALTPVGDNKGTISGEVLLADNETEFVTISFRQSVGDKEIEVASLTVGAEGPFDPFLLPYGDYKVVLSMTGHETQSSTFTLDAATLEIGTFDFTTL